MEFENNTIPKVQVEDIDSSFDQIINKPFISNELKKEISNCNVIFLPIEGFRDFPEPMFPSHTEELFEFLKNNSSNELKPEVLIESKDYKEYDLHFDLTPLGGFLIENVVFPLFVSALYDYLKSFFAGIEENKQNIEIEVSFYEKGNNKIKKIKYKGPYNKYDESIKNTLGK